MEKTIKIGGELESVATGGIVAAASAIKDKAKGKFQGEINAEVDASLEDRYTKEETYSKQELNSLITTPSTNYETVEATEETTDVTDVLPATGEADTIYRVGSWDGSQYDATCYSEYAWKGDAYIHLSTKSQIGEVFDISAYHATGGELATYADLAAALDSNNGGGVPQSLQKGGMSVKFVQGSAQSSDNNYIQFRCKTQSFSANPEDWAFCGDDILTENPEYMKVETDAEGKIMHSVNAEDGAYWFHKIKSPTLDSMIEDIQDFKEEIEGEVEQAIEDSQTELAQHYDYYNVSKHHSVRDVFNVYTVNDGWKQIEYNSSLIQYDALDVYQIGEQCNYGGDIEHSYETITSHRGVAPATITQEYVTRPKFTLEEAIAVLPEEVLTSFAAGQKICFVDLDDFIEEWQITEGGTWERISPYDVKDPEGRIEIKLDAESKIVAYRKADGTWVECVGIEAPNLGDYVDKEEGKSLIDAGFAESQSTIEDPEGRLRLELDEEDKIMDSVEGDGSYKHNTKHIFNGGIELNEQTMTEFQQALKDSGFRPGIINDFSDAGKDYPLRLPFSKVAAKINFIVDRPITEECLNPFTGEDEQSGLMEYYDYYGNYFKKACVINTQGQTSQRNRKKNIGLDIDDKSEISFGDWVPQDSFHIKAHPNDITGTRLVAAYKFVEEVYKAIGGRPFDAINDDSSITYLNSTGNIYADFKNNVLCHPDGFAVEIYFNGEWWGLGMLQLKKHRKNYGMNKKDYESVLLDMNETLNYFWGGKDTIGWTVQGMMDIKNPKKMIAIDGSEWDEGKEIIGSNTVFKKSFTLNSIPSGFTGGTVSVAVGDSTTIQVNIPSTATIEDVRDALIAQTYPNFTCTKSGSKTIIFEYTGGGNIAPDVTITCNGSVPLVFTNKVISVQYNSGNKDMKNTAKTKKVIEDIADSYNIVHSLESELDNNAAAKAKFEELFDKDACEAVYIINCFLNNSDSIKKNTLWMKYKDSKIAPAPYDLDGTFGGGVTGLSVGNPNASLWAGVYATSAWPLAFVWKYYKDELIAKYGILRDNKVISVDTFENIFNMLYEQQGFSGIEREIKKWEPAPYRDAGNLNSDYWRIGTYGDDTTWTQWNKDTEYQINDCVFVVGENNVNAEAIKGERLYGQKYVAIAPNQNQCPVDTVYDNFPYTGGMYDSIKRQIKWVEEQIALCDAVMQYSA